MSTIVFFLASLVLGIALFSKIPGLEHFVKPIIDLLFTFIKFLSSNAMAWGLYIFKVFWNSHIDFLRHLFLPASSIDPSAGLKENSDAPT